MYPESIKPAFVTKLQNHYVTTYKDNNFINPPTWFKSYVILEILYHGPLCLWAIPALIKGKIMDQLLLRDAG